MSGTPSAGIACPGSTSAALMVLTWARARFAGRKQRKNIEKERGLAQTQYESMDFREYRLNAVFRQTPRRRQRQPTHRSRGSLDRHIGTGGARSSDHGGLLEHAFGGRHPDTDCFQRHLTRRQARGSGDQKSDQPTSCRLVPRLDRRDGWRGVPLQSLLLSSQLFDIFVLLIKEHQIAFLELISNTCQHVFERPAVAADL